MKHGERIPDEYVETAYLTEVKKMSDEPTEHVLAFKGKNVIVSVVVMDSEGFSDINAGREAIKAIQKWIDWVHEL